MTKQEQIQSAVDAAIASVPFQHRQRDTKTTKKALAEIETLGLTEYLPPLMREHGGKYASSVAAVIKAATFAGSSKIASSMSEDGDSWVETEEAHELYNLLNAPEEKEDTETNKLSGYKIGDEVQVRTNVIYSGTPQNGEVFETRETGVIIAEGFTSINAYGDNDQQNIIINVNDSPVIRNAAQIS